MTIEVGKTYTEAELQEFMEVSKDKWNHKRNELLDNFAIYYEYEVNYNDSKQRNNWTYTIIKQLGEYQKIPRKSKKTSQKKEEATKLIEEKIIEIITEDNLQTAANIARIFTAEYSKDFEKFGYTEGTLYELTRLKMREMFGTQPYEGGTHGYYNGKVWCIADVSNNVYIEMSEQVHKWFSNAYQNNSVDSYESEMEIMDAYENKEITKAEMIKKVGEMKYDIFRRTREDFKAQYGSYPVKVPEYEIGFAWFNKDFKWE